MLRQKEVLDRDETGMGFLSEDNNNINPATASRGHINIATTRRGPQ